MYWKETECLLCVALRHPLPATRSSALERLKKDLPPDRTVSTIDAWLDA